MSYAGRREAVIHLERAGASYRDTPLGRGEPARLEGRNPDFGWLEESDSRRLE